LSVLRTAGKQKRSEAPGTDEEFILRRTLRDMNMSKFVTEDIDLFKDLLEDIFSVKDPPKKVYKAEETQVRKLLREYNLVEEPLWFMRIF